MKKWKVERIAVPKVGDDYDRCQAWDTFGNQCELEPQHQGLHQTRWFIKKWKYSYKPATDGVRDA